MIALKRIALVLFFIGSITLFTFWSTNEFNKIVEDLSDDYVASAYIGYQFMKAAESNSANQEVSTSTDTSETSSVSVAQAATTSSKVEFSYSFPQKGDEVYIGCTYSISWKSSAVIDSLGISLVDADVREEVGPIASGLAKENTINKEIQNLKWTVGGVLPGEYYMKISDINGAEAESRSDIFVINKMSDNISSGEKEIICKGSGGLF